MSLDRPGRLVVFEGIDGLGKSTQLRRMANRLRAAGLPVRTSREPTDGPWGTELRASARADRLGLDEELHLLRLDRRHHVDACLRPWLAAGDIVLLDRCHWSTAAYQGARGADPAALLREFDAFFPAPDRVYLFDAPVEVALARIHGRDGTPDAFEEAGNLARIRAIYHTIDAPGRVLIPADQAPDLIEALLWKDLTSHILRPWGCVDATACPWPGSACIVPDCALAALCPCADP